MTRQPTEKKASNRQSVIMEDEQQKGLPGRQSTRGKYQRIKPLKSAPSRRMRTALTTLTLAAAHCECQEIAMDARRRLVFASPKFIGPLFQVRAGSRSYHWKMSTDRDTGGSPFRSPMPHRLIAALDTPLPTIGCLTAANNCAM